MAGVVASKVRKQRAKDALNLKGEADEAAQRKLNQIPVGPGGVRQLPGHNSGRRRNRDASLYQNADGTFESGGSANVILYVGLGMISVGLVITFVGLGEKGFKTLELKLIGPSLVGCGVFFTLLRVLFCTLPSCCRKIVKKISKTEDAEKLLKAEQGRQDRTTSTLERVGGKSNGTARHPSKNSHRRIEARRPVPPQNSRPRQPSDSEDEPEPNDVRPRIKPVRQKGRRQDTGDNHSNTSSSNFSIVEDLAVPKPRELQGSTKNLRPGEVILNATRLNVAPT